MTNGEAGRVLGGAVSGERSCLPKASVKTRCGEGAVDLVGGDLQ